LGGALYFWYATRPRPPARPKGRPGPEPAADRSAGFQPALGRPGPEPAAWLEVIRPTGDRQRCPLTADSPLVIGRVPSADLCLDDEQVSWRHAQIERTGETFSVADLDSTNGTLVNGQRVSQSSLRDGDRIQIGRTVLTFRQGVE
jgi:hypothetical protein